jgi:hypothetical protein
VRVFSQAVEQKCFSTILFAFREPNQVHLNEQSALDRPAMDSTFILSAVFCIGFVFGYGVRALISQIRRQQVRRLRQYRSFLTSSPRMLSEEQQAARTTV